VQCGESTEHVFAPAIDAEDGDALIGVTLISTPSGTNLMPHTTQFTYDNASTPVEFAAKFLSEFKLVPPVTTNPLTDFGAAIERGIDPGSSRPRIYLGSHEMVSGTPGTIAVTKPGYTRVRIDSSHPGCTLPGANSAAMPDIAVRATSGRDHLTFELNLVNLPPGSFFLPAAILYFTGPMNVPFPGMLASGCYLPQFDPLGPVITLSGGLTSPHVTFPLPNETYSGLDFAFMFVVIVPGHTELFPVVKRIRLE
jgi:hypothetical protein